MINSYSFVGSTTTTALQAAGADVALANNVLSITSVMPIGVNGIITAGGITGTIPAVAGVWTYTPVAAASTTYGVEIQQYVASLGRTVRVLLEYTSKTSGDTATTIGDALRAELVTYAGTGIDVTGSGTATFILTASVTNPFISVTATQAGTLQSQIVNGTAGVAAINTTAALLSAGFTGTTENANAVPVSGATYASIELVFKKTNTSDTAGDIGSGLYQHTLFCDLADANKALFLIALAIAANTVGNDGTSAGTQTLTGAGAINVTQFQTSWTTTAADAGTLAAGTEGQIKYIVMAADGGDGTLTVTNPLTGNTTITFNDAGDSVLLWYKNAKWRLIANNGCTAA